MEFILWHLFKLVPYVIRYKEYNIKFYCTIEECQKFDKWFYQVTVVNKSK